MTSTQPPSNPAERRTDAHARRSTSSWPPRAECDDVPDDEKGFFDLERLTNPYDDTRICHGDPDLEVHGLTTGIDAEVGEVVLADRLREREAQIDAARQLSFASMPCHTPADNNVNRFVETPARCRSPADA